MKTWILLIALAGSNAAWIFHNDKDDKLLSLQENELLEVNEGLVDLRSKLANRESMIRRLHSSLSEIKSASERTSVGHSPTECPSWNSSKEHISKDYSHARGSFEVENTERGWPADNKTYWASTTDIDTSEVDFIPIDQSPMWID